MTWLGNAQQHFEAGRDEKGELTMEYLVVIEKAENNYSASLPDLPGCVATGETPEEVVSAIKKAVQVHLQGMREDGMTVPRSSARADYLQIEQAV
jgi:predicted RNase H-like HicB family nuclease